MAAEESSQGAALGPDLSDPDPGNRPPNDGIPDLHDVLGEFLQALCVVETISLALLEVMEESPCPVGACAVALEHGFNLLRTVYDRFDRGLVAHEESRREGSEESGAEDNDDIVIEIGPSVVAHEGGTVGDCPA
jgi:hypothetical protein